MKHISFSIIICLLLSPAAFADKSPEDAVRSVLLKQQAAWNAGNLEAFMEGYLEDESITFYSGNSIRRGHRTIYERYKKSYQAEGKEMGVLDFSDLRIELLGETSAFVRGHWKVVMSDGKAPEGLFTLVFKKFEDGWKIVHDHTSSKPKEPAQDTAKKAD